MEHALNRTLLCLRLNQRSRVHRGKILAHFKLSRCAVWFLTTRAAHRFFPVLAPSMTECLRFFGTALMPSMIYRGFAAFFEGCLAKGLIGHFRIGHFRQI